MTILPRQVGHIGVPPVKCQGIKTKLVPFIFVNVKWDSGSSGRWIEPFLGSGVVTLNLDSIPMRFCRIDVVGEHPS